MKNNRRCLLARLTVTHMVYAFFWTFHVVILFYLCFVFKVHNDFFFFSEKIFSGCYFIL